MPREVLDDPVTHYGIEFDPDEPREDALRTACAGAHAVVDLADEPVVAARVKLRLASLALHLGLAYETATESFEPPRFERLDYAGRVLAVIGTGKRTGKTAVAGHLAGCCASRPRPGDRVDGAGRAAGAGGRAAGPGVADLEALAARAATPRRTTSRTRSWHACRRRVPARRRLAGRRPVRDERRRRRAACRRRSRASTRWSSRVGRVRAAGGGGRTVCVVGDPRDALEALGPYRLLRADLVLAMREVPAELARARAARPCLQRPARARAGGDGAGRRARGVLQHGCRRGGRARPGRGLAEPRAAP